VHQLGGQGQRPEHLSGVFFARLEILGRLPREKVERLAADAELMIDVARILESTAMAETMYAGVRVGGSEHLKAKFSWGFGRQRE
jgi:hypothetical protein